MQVKGFMPPKDGISRKTPTGSAVGRNVVWHNFSVVREFVILLDIFISFAI